jgi:hypothetical protein
MFCVEVGMSGRMSKFKVGDKVVVVKGEYEGFPAGSLYNLPRGVGEVVDSDTGYVVVRWGDFLSPPVNSSSFALAKYILPGEGLKASSDGGATGYYDFPAGFTTLNDLIEYKNMPFWLGNIFKACFRFGEKDAATKEYDLNKIIYFAGRGLGVLRKEKE